MTGEWKGRYARQRDGLPPCTQSMLNAMRGLAAGDSGRLLHHRTVGAMLKNGWCELVATGYRLTPAGRHALDVYSGRRNRNDNLCPDCGVRERLVYASGRVRGYCRRCQSKRQVRYNERARYRQKLAMIERLLS